MRPSALAAFFPFSVEHEGEEPWMYLDALGYVTTGVGNFAEPVSVAEAMPWVNADGSASSAAEIAAAWEAVDAERSDPKGEKQTSGLATRYGGAFGGVTSIRLTPAGIQQLFNTQLAANETAARRYFPTWDNLPADVQMGIASMQWALGSDFPPKFPQFTAAINAWDFATAAADADFKGTGVATRIAADKLMFENGAAVVAGGLDGATLYYPGSAAGASSGSGAVAAFVGGLFGIALGIAWRVWGAH